MARRGDYVKIKEDEESLIGITSKSYTSMVGKIIEMSMAEHSKCMLYKVVFTNRSSWLFFEQEFIVLDKTNGEVMMEQL